MVILHLTDGVNITEGCSGEFNILFFKEDYTIITILRISTFLFVEG